MPFFDHEMTKVRRNEMTGGQVTGRICDMAMFTSTARSGLSTLDSMATPCSVNAQGGRRRLILAGGIGGRKLRHPIFQFLGRQLKPSSSAKEFSDVLPIHAEPFSSFRLRGGQHIADRGGKCLECLLEWDRPHRAARLLHKDEVDQFFRIGIRFITVSSAKCPNTLHFQCI